MTSLDPSHNIFRESSGRHAQAVHRADDIPLSQPEDSDGDLSVDDGLPERVHERKAKREARRKVRGAMPPMPDLRFEQSYLLSIRPFLTARSASSSKPAASSSGPSEVSTALIKPADEDRVFGWDKQLDVNWTMVIYVTLRDQLFSPLVQGALWGWGTFLLASTATALRTSLYPASASRNRVTLNSDPSSSGLMGDISDRKGGEAGWWRRFVKSWTGGIEAATVT